MNWAVVLAVASAFGGAPIRALATEALRSLPSGAGIVAVWSNSRILLIAHTGQPIEVPGITSTSIPRMRWSPDGRWLAVLTNGSVRVVQLKNQAVMARTIALPIDDFSSIAWSPHSDVFIVTSRAGFSVAGVDGRTRQTFQTVDLSVENPAQEAVWNRDGSLVDRVFAVRRRQERKRDEIVVVRFDDKGNEKETMLLATSAFSEALAIAAVADPERPALLVWPNLGFGADASGGEPLDLFTPHHRLRLLTRTFPAADWIRLSGDRSFLAVVSGHAAEDEAWTDKQLMICTFRPASCTYVAIAAGTAILDPTISDDGRLFGIQSRLEPLQSIRTQAQRLQWLDETRLVEISAGRARVITAAGSGIKSPVVAHDGRSVMFLKRDGLYFLKLNSAALPQRVAPAFADDELNFGSRFGFFGERGRENRFAWSASANGQ